jgi:hypothetical protein
MEISTSTCKESVQEITAAVAQEGRDETRSEPLPKSKRVVIIIDDDEDDDEDDDDWFWRPEETIFKWSCEDCHDSSITVQWNHGFSMMLCALCKRSLEAGYRCRR